MGHTDVQGGPPDYVGVGVQGAGGEWWQQLLLQHPEIHGEDDGAGRHFFDLFCRREMTREDVAGYLASFARPPGTIAGEWTSRYMYDLWTPRLLHRVAPEARLLVIVRDPIARFHHGIRYQKEVSPERQERLAAFDAIERGRYATQLRRLLRWFERDRILVLQYERCRADPAAEYARTLRFLGVGEDFEPDVSGAPEEPAEPEPLWPDMEAALKDTFAAEVQDLAALVPDLDLRRWPAFAPPRRRRLLARLGR